jgi:ABC-type antimicrobial peptide transport system permease subunit
MQSVLFESGGLNSNAFLFSFLLLAAVTLIASFLPAWRAAKIEPAALVKT